MTPEVLTLFILNAFFALFASVAFVLSMKINLYYDKNATSKKQYLLEKQSYLAATIIKYIFFIKIPLFIFFIFTLEKISLVLPGAMCSAGVVNATDYGVYLLLVKLLNLYLFAYWILLNAQDMKSETQEYLKLKFLLFVPFYFLLIIEIVLESLMFFSIDIQDVVDCCGVLFSTSDGTYMANLLGSSAQVQMTLFYATFLLLLFGFFKKQKTLFGVSNIVFVFISLVTLIGFFGTYIYEMPTHHCPFCLLAKEYNYVGYFLYITLFFGTFFGASLALVDFSKEDEKRHFSISMICTTLYTLSVSSFVLIYFFKNSVWL